MRIFTRNVFIIVLFQGSLSIVFGQNWKLPGKIDALIASCVEIPCTYTPLKRLEASNVAKYILHNLINSAGSLVSKDFENRTSLVTGNNSCALRLDPVRKEDNTHYLPRIVKIPQKNAFHQNFHLVWLNVEESPEPPRIIIPQEITAGTPTNATCFANHTCGSSPPIITWNKPGQIGRRSEDLSGGYWREKSKLVFDPSHEDDGTPIRCTITYRNGHTVQREATLNIRYSAVGVEAIKSNTAEGIVELKCVFLSSRPAVTHYTWIKDGSKLNEERRSLLFDSQGSNSGFYTCIAHNAVGSATSAEVHVSDYELKKYTEKLIYVTSLALLGCICVISVIMAVCLYRRLKSRQATPRRPNAELPEALYAALEKTDNPCEYETLKLSSLSSRAANAAD